MEEGRYNVNHYTQVVSAFADCIFELVDRTGFDERQCTRRKRLGSFCKCELPPFERPRDGPISPVGGLHESTSNVTNLAINFRRWRRLIGGLVSGTDRLRNENYIATEYFSELRNDGSRAITSSGAGPILGGLGISRDILSNTFGLTWEFRLTLRKSKWMYCYNTETKGTYYLV